MAKVNSTASEVQLKARRTSLGKKTNDELITIILRKDKSERNMNSKIQELQALIKKANELNENKDIRILGFEKDMEGMQEIVKVKQEQIDNLISEKNKIEDDYNNALKKINHLKYLCRLRRKVIFTCFAVIASLIVLLCVL